MNRNRTSTLKVIAVLMSGPQVLAGVTSPDVEVRLVPATTPHAQDQLPSDDSYFSSRYSFAEDRYVLLDDLPLPFNFVVEIWISDVGSLNTGVTSAYFDVSWSNGSITDALAITHGTLFGLFPEGAIDDPVDRVVNCGGSDPKFAGQGREPTFARVGWIEFSHTARGSLDVDATEGLGEIGVRNRTVGVVRIVGAGVRVCLADADCDDENACTNDSCSNGGCVHSEDIRRCNDGHECTNDFCDPATGQCSHSQVDCRYLSDGCNYVDCDQIWGCYIAGPCGGEVWPPTFLDPCCDDGNPATLDYCTLDWLPPFTHCIHVDCDDGNPCTTDPFDFDYESCAEHAPDDTVLCDDGIVCNGSDRCSGGACSVHADDACPEDTVCDESTDTCRQLVDCDPDHCNVDARMPNDPQDSNIFLTNDTFVLHYNGTAEGLSSASYEVSMLPPVGTLPAVAIVMTAGGDATLVLDRPIRPNRFTCIRDIAINQRCCFGVLPGDADDSLLSEQIDVFRLIENLGGQVAEPLLPEKCDIDRSGQCTGADLLMEIDVLNGAGAFEVYSGRSLSACPAMKP